MAFTITGTDCSHASRTTSENDSRADGEIETMASRTMSHLSASLTAPVRTMSSSPGIDAAIGPDEGQGQRAGVALLVGPEERRQHRRALVVVDAAHAHDVGTVADAEDLAAGAAPLDDGGDAQSELDLGDLGHPVATLHEPALGRGVVADGVGAGEGGVEHLEVQRGLVVRGGMQHRAVRVVTSMPMTVG